MRATLLLLLVLGGCRPAGGPHGRPEQRLWERREAAVSAVEDLGYQLSAGPTYAQFSQSMFERAPAVGRYMHDPAGSSDRMQTSVAMSWMVYRALRSDWRLDVRRSGDPDLAHDEGEHAITISTHIASATQYAEAARADLDSLGR